MNYKELVFTINSSENYHTDILISMLGAINYDTFEETEEGFKAYIAEGEFDEGLLKGTLEAYKEDCEFTYSINHVEQQNWNEVWESNFEPIEIKDQVYVRATFHQPKPAFKYEIVIDPKMSFGTGHHQTTAMIMEYLLETDVSGKTVLDMGCGTAILAILASKMGAKSVMAIDYDAVCYDSTLENASLNGIANLSALCGSKEVIPNEQYEIVLANINRNILLDQIERYSQALVSGGAIFFSGFYEEPDLQMITEEANKYGINYVNHKKKDLWVAAKFIKN